MGRFLGALFLIALAVGGTFATWPELGDLEMTAPWVQIVSMRGLGASIALFFAVVLLLVRAGASRGRGYLSAVTVILFAFVIANATILGIRGIFPGALPKPSSEQIRVLAWNTLGDAVPIDTLVEAADTTYAQVIVLPETTRQHATELATALNEDLGKPFAVHTLTIDPNYKALSTSVLIAEALGAYVPTEAYGSTSVVPSLVLEPKDRGSRPRIVGIHSVSPITEEMDSWREDQAWLGSMCDLPNTIIAGDANATIDHLNGHEGCSIGALQAGAGGLGTWPTTLPTLLGAPVDQTITSHDWRTIGFSVLSAFDGTGSDHRPIAAVVVKNDSPAAQ